MRNRPSRRPTSTISARTGTIGPAATWSTPFGPYGATCWRPIATRSSTRSTRSVRRSAGASPTPTASWLPVRARTRVRRASMRRITRRSISHSTHRRALVCGASSKSFDRWVRSPGFRRSSRRRSLSIADLLDKAAGGGRLSFDEGVRLYEEAPLHELGAAAHARRMSLFPTDDVTYVIDTTINYTNVCNVHCTFCAFFRPQGHAEGYTMSHDKVLERVKYAADQGATQIMIQGGVNPELRIEWFEELFRRVAIEFPNVDIHSLSVSEIAGLAKIEELPVREVLVR